MELETVPDTEDYILLDKIGMSMGVYSGVYEYTQQIQEQIQSIQSIQGIWAFAELQAGSLQYNIVVFKIVTVFILSIFFDIAWMSIRRIQLSLSLSSP